MDYVYLAMDFVVANKYWFIVAVPIVGAFILVRFLGH